mmetsp:Transcript_46773/g.111247  ORF Transcript_46773/g.111247 Transcript_46773/m.111247 type:complete len:551 (-) Transcript_46773:5-1657(-)
MRAERRTQQPLAVHTSRIAHGTQAEQQLPHGSSSSASRGSMEFREVSPRSRARMLQQESSSNNSNYSPRRAMAAAQAAEAAKQERERATAANMRHPPPPALSSPTGSGPPVFSGTFVAPNDAEPFEVISPKRSPQELPWLEEEDGTRGSAEVMEVLMSNLKLEEPVAAAVGVEGGPASSSQAAAVALRQALAAPRGAVPEAQGLPDFHTPLAVQGPTTSAGSMSRHTTDGASVASHAVAVNGMNPSGGRASPPFDGAAAPAGVPPEGAVLALLGEVLRDNAVLTAAVDGVMARLVGIESALGCNGHIPRTPKATVAVECDDAPAVALEESPAAASTSPKVSTIPLPFQQESALSTANIAVLQAGGAELSSSSSFCRSEQRAPGCDVAVQCNDLHMAQDLAVLSGLLGDRGPEDQDALLYGLAPEELALLEVKLQDVVRAVRVHRERRSPRRRRSSQAPAAARSVQSLSSFQGTASVAPSPQPCQLQDTASNAPSGAAASPPAAPAAVAAAAVVAASPQPLMSPSYATSPGSPVPPSLCEGRGSLLSPQST